MRDSRCHLYMSPRASSTTSSSSHPTWLYVQYTHPHPLFQNGCSDLAVAPLAPLLELTTVSAVNGKTRSGMIAKADSRRMKSVIGSFLYHPIESVSSRR
jgi:hypothetical protein